MFHTFPPEFLSTIPLLLLPNASLLFTLKISPLVIVVGQHVSIMWSMVSSSIPHILHFLSRSGLYSSRPFSLLPCLIRATNYIAFPFSRYMGSACGRYRWKAVSGRLRLMWAILRDFVVLQAFSQNFRFVRQAFIIILITHRIIPITSLLHLPH